MHGCIQNFSAVLTSSSLPDAPAGLSLKSQHCSTLNLIFNSIGDQKFGKSKFEKLEPGMFGLFCMMNANRGLLRWLT